MHDFKVILIGTLLGAAAVVWLVSRFDRQGEGGCFYRLVMTVLLVPALLLAVVGF